ncbi:MAG: FAD-dependent oxidoreductase [Nitrosomonas sp.]|nr:FAD-dependent oxidoreductase [Nitrosomonas sp.]MDP1950261.1 FAD-dependent oxidoreductase [Nitrosomonas sp.]
MKKEIKIMVIGAGISGLTTAICLREQGFGVVIVAEKFAPALVSNVAGALWEWPPAACGKHGTPRSLERSKVWCVTAYEKFKALQAEFGSTATGIYLRKATFYFREILENLPEDLNKMNELAGKVDDFRRGLDIVPKTIDLAFQKGIRDAYQHMAPMVDTDVYLQWLFHQAESLGCRIIEEKIEVNLIEQEQALLARFHCAAIVNCAALGSIEIANDPSMYPLRGALVRVKDEQGLVDGAHCISHKELSNDEQSIIFIVPRGHQDTVILGGLVQLHQWGGSMSLEDPIIRQMYDGCLQFLPVLRSLPLDEQEPVRSGLRPFTEANVCVERVPATHLFYNYGHGGAGVSLSWGCAEEIVEHIQAMQQEEETLTPFADILLDHQKPTVFLLQDKLQIKSDLAFIRNHGYNLAVLCSRSGLSKIVPAQFEHLSCVQILESYDLPHLLESFNQVKHFFKLKSEKCRVITNDECAVLLAAEMRLNLGLAGDKPQQMLPFVDKSVLRNVLKNTPVRMPASVVFDAKEYQAAEENYLTHLTAALDFPLFAKPVIGAGSKKTTRIPGKKELTAWCASHRDKNERFELCEWIQGTHYSTSVMVINGEISYFAPYQHFRPDHEFLHGKPIGSRVVRAEDPEYPVLFDFSIQVLNSLPSGYPPDGVINLDFIVDKKTGGPVLLEIAARAPGGSVSKMFDTYQGVALSEWHLRLQMGAPGKPVIKAKKDQRYSAYCLHPKQAGTVTEIEKPVFSSTTEVFWQICPGQKLGPAENTRDAALAIFLSNGNWEDLKRDFEVANSQRYFVVQPFAVKES